jgi:hypothetical protein
MTASQTVEITSVQKKPLPLQPFAARRWKRLCYEGGGCNLVPRQSHSVPRQSGRVRIADGLHSPRP